VLRHNLEPERLGVMAHRSFKDRKGRHWDVWNVIPTKVERRQQDEPVDDDRRSASEPRVRLGRSMATGWLCFETHGEKRRLAPFPAEWEGMTSEQLGELCESAELAPSARRLVK
jgi:hypothetical protein